MFKFCLNIRIVRISGLLSALIFIMLCAASIDAYAQMSGGFSIRAVIPDNQIDKKQTYFDLRMKPDEEQEIQVVITNSRKEELVARLQLNNASTGRNGLIVYTVPDIRGELMKVAFTDVAALGEQKVTVPALGSATVNIKLKMPSPPFDGVLLGGIAVTGDVKENDANQTQGVRLKNSITYVIGIKLTENDNKVNPDFDLTAITPELVNYRTAVIATLQNKAAHIVKDMDVKAQVFKKGSQSPIHDLHLPDAEMAPLSEGNFVIDWKNQPLVQGTYRLKMTVKYSGQTWEWDEEFTISEEADDLNGTAVGLTKDRRWMYMLAGVFGAALLALMLIIAYRMGKKHKREDVTDS